MIDRYSFSEQRISYWYNDDPACAEANQLDPSKKWVVSFNGHNAIPSAWVYEGEDQIDLEQLIFLATTGVVKGTPKWSQRSHAAIFDMMQNGIVYMMPDLPSPEELSQDWKVQLMARITEMTQEQDTGFVPIVSLYENTNPYVPGLAEMMQVDKESLPNFFVLHPMTDQLVKYPEPLDDIRNFSPEMMLTWARAVALSFELEKFAYDIKEAKLREDISDEQKEQVVEILAGYLTDT